MICHAREKIWSRFRLVYGSLSLSYDDCGAEAQKLHHLLRIQYVMSSDSDGWHMLKSDGFPQHRFVSSVNGLRAGD